MRINCDKLQQFAINLAVIIAQLNEQRDKLNKTISKLTQNSCVDEVIIALQKSERELEEQIAVLMQTQKAAEKIVLMYKESESRISENIESNWCVEKQRFNTISLVKVDTELNWSVN